MRSLYHCCVGSVVQRGVSNGSELVREPDVELAKQPTRVRRMLKRGWGVGREAGGVRVNAVTN